MRCDKGVHEIVLNCRKVVGGLDVRMCNVHAANSQLQLVSSTADWPGAFTSMPLVAKMAK